jgi:hypothetical protein
MRNKVFNRKGYLTRALSSVIMLTGMLPCCLAQSETFPTLTSAPDSIGAKFHVRFGLEYEASDKDRDAFALNLGVDTVAQVMDELVSQKTKYKWKLVNGIYDIYPKESADSITAVKIKAFHTSNENFQAVSRAVADIPEVKEWLEKNGVKRREFQIGSAGKTESRMSMALSQTTLRSVLNQIVAQDERAYWVVVRYGDKLEYISITF